VPKQFPIDMGIAAKHLLRKAVPFTGQPIPEFADSDLVERRPIRMDAFTITRYLVDYSAYDAYALQIEVGGKRFFITVISAGMFARSHC
jgi:hypothetical protein